MQVKYSTLQATKLIELIQVGNEIVSLLKDKNIKELISDIEVVQQLADKAESVKKDLTVAQELKDSAQSLLDAAKAKEVKCVEILAKENGLNLKEETLNSRFAEIEKIKADLQKQISDAQAAEFKANQEKSIAIVKQKEAEDEKDKAEKVKQEYNKKLEILNQLKS